MGLTQTITVVNGTRRTLDVGVEPLAEFSEAAGGETVTYRTTFVQGAAQLEIVTWDDGISLFLFGPTDLPNGESLPNYGPSEIPVAADSLLVINDRTAVLHLLIDGAAVDVESGGRRRFVVRPAADTLLMTIGTGELTLDGWQAWPA